MTPENFNCPHQFLLTAEAAVLLRLSKRTLEKYRMTGSVDHRSFGSVVGSSIAEPT
jgi:hypothetical protein